MASISERLGPFGSCSPLHPSWQYYEMCSHRPPPSPSWRHRGEGSFARYPLPGGGARVAKLEEGLRDWVTKVLDGHEPMYPIVDPEDEPQGGYDNDYGGYDGGDSGGGGPMAMMEGGGGGDGVDELDEL